MTDNKKPFFARFLETADKAELPVASVAAGATKPKATTKYPSDRDEYQTLKYPSDGDEGGVDI